MKTLELNPNTVGYFFIHHIDPEDSSNYISYEWEDLDKIKEFAEGVLNRYGGNKIRIMYNDNGKLRIAATVHERNKNAVQN